MTSVVTFDGAPPAGTINLGLGQPSADLLPVRVMRCMAEAFFADAHALEMNYGELPGDERFLASLAAFLEPHYAAQTRPDELFLTAGNSQAIDLVSASFARPGDTIFVEEPTYFLAYGIFRDHGFNIVGIPLDDQGPDLDVLRARAARLRPRFFYTIPSYQNPSGVCMSGARRDGLVRLADELDFLIVADEVYQLLHYFEPPPPALGTMSASERVVSLGSFSKILAPAVRLGWIQTSGRHRRSLLANGFLNSGGSINHLMSHLVRKAMATGLLTAHIESLRAAYRERLLAMEESLQTHFSGLADWTRPDGGYFFWLRFADGVDTAPLKAAAAKRQTGFQSGAVFSCNSAFRNFLRLSFAHYRPDDIEEGIARLRRVFDTIQ